MKKEYKTFEQKVWKIGKPGVETLGYVIKGVYDAVATTFRIPTFLRRVNKKQTHPIHPMRDDYVIGIFTGGVINTAILARTLDEVITLGDYTPLLILGSTNLASGIYELGKASEKKQSTIENIVETKETKPI